MTVEWTCTIEELREAIARAAILRRRKKSRNLSGTDAAITVLPLVGIGAALLLPRRSVTGTFAFDILLPLAIWQLARTIVLYAGGSSKLKSDAKAAASALLLACAFAASLLVERADPHLAGQSSRWWVLVSPHIVWISLLWSIVWQATLISRRQVQSMWDGNPSLQRPTVLEVTDAGLTLSTHVSRLELSWFAFSLAIDSDNLFLLFEGEQSYHVIPKRIFTSEQLAEFRDIVEVRITNRPIAFPVIPIQGPPPLPPPPLASR